jgi:hypothetical protein
LPLNQARATGSRGRAGSSATAPFGVGIHPSGGSGDRSAAGGSHRRGTAGTGTYVRGASHAGAVAPAAILRAASEQGPGGHGSILALIGGGVAILILGGFGGVLMRHSQRAGHPG